MCFRIAFFAGFAIVLALPGVNGQGRSLAQDDASWRERFLAEAPLAWENYRTRAKRLQGTVERTTVRLDHERKVMSRSHFEIKQRDGCALWFAQDLGEGDPPSEVGTVGGINRDYGFELRRQNAAVPWFVRHLVTDLHDGMKFEQGTHPSEAVPLWTTCATTFMMIPKGKEIDIKDPGFALKRVTPVPRDDGQAVRVEFNYRNADKRGVPVVEGWVLYDPQHFWVIREYELELEWPSVQGSKVTAAVNYVYKESADGFPIPKRVTTTTKSPTSGSHIESQREFELKEADVAERDFTLSAFGLTEPGGLKKPTRWYLWAAILGIVCLSGGALFYWRTRGTRRPASTAQRG